MIHRTSPRANKAFGKISHYVLDGRTVDERGEKKRMAGELHLPCSVEGQEPFVYPLVGQRVNRTLVDGALSQRFETTMLVLTQRCKPGMECVQWAGTISSDGQWSGTYYHLQLSAASAEPKERSLSPSEDHGRAQSYGHFMCRLVPFSDGKSLPFAILRASVRGREAGATAEGVWNGEEKGKKSGERTGQSDSDEFSIGIADKLVKDRQVLGKDKSAEEAEAKAKVPAQAEAEKGTGGENENGVGIPKGGLSDLRPRQTVGNGISFSMQYNNDNLFHFDEEESNDPDLAHPGGQTTKLQGLSADTKATAADVQDENALDLDERPSDRIRIKDPIAEDPEPAQEYYSMSLPMPIPRPLRQRQDRESETKADRKRANLNHIQEEDSKKQQIVPPHTLVENDFWSFATDLRFPKTARAVMASIGSTRGGRGNAEKEKVVVNPNFNEFEKIPIKNTTVQPPTMSLQEKAFKILSLCPDYKQK
eukprot:CAMPEP_0184492914 /NCGR_PEP_ID=MMETSP0113_2-20130426/24585_1 /TAXON_ID=91329 /ORGANISM="Norrisiella sphaerica, Strain BC52" /LENGTH=477 /DNA_ID=CAMNT_0026877953 /DNA_START=54 /DNA_END=1488 /DNA_ORIENTATION=+